MWAKPHDLPAFPHLFCSRSLYEMIESHAYWLLSLRHSLLEFHRQTGLGDCLQLHNLLSL